MRQSLRDGQVVPLDDQDRDLWDTRHIDEGRALLQRAMTRRRTGPYPLQAAIADLHLYQPRDWRQIAALYQTLARQTASPIVEMNRAIAVAEIDGPRGRPGHPRPPRPPPLPILPLSPSPSRHQALPTADLRWRPEARLPVPERHARRPLADQYLRFGVCS